MIYEKIIEATEFIRSQTDLIPATGLILGTGLGALADEIQANAIIEYKDIPHFPVSTVPGHAGRLIIGTLNGEKVVAMAGRFHYYEGYTMQEVTFPVRVMKALGIYRIIISNAAGSTNGTMEPGDLVFINDHINLQPDNPLRGPNDDRLGVRFPDLLHTYDQEMIRHALLIARKFGIRAQTGVYVSLPGPNLETPAEYKFLHTIGGDVVGMSTIPEVLVAKHAGLRIFVLSVVSNKCYPLDQIVETTLEDVLSVVRAAEPRATRVVKELLGKAVR